MLPQDMVMMMFTFSFIAHDFINLNAQCADGGQGEWGHKVLCFKTPSTPSSRERKA